MNWSPAQLSPWLSAIRNGEPAAAPAEGVYGYVANPFNPSALQAIVEAKSRSANKGFIVLVQSPSQLGQLCASLSPECQAAIETYWQPGQPATTLILPAGGGLSPLLSGEHGTLAIRMPQLEYMQEYLRAAAIPLVSTSLNLSGEPPATHANQLPADLPALTLSDALSGTPSRIFNPMSGQWLR